MRSVNKVILIGNLTRDPEMKKTQSGQPIVTFGMATNRQWITSDGRKETSAEYHEVVAWARLAETCQKYLKKGKLVYVEGYLKTRKWQAEDGTPRYKTEIVVQDMIMLEKRPKGEEEEFFEEPHPEDMMNGGTPAAAAEPAAAAMNHDAQKEEEISF